MWNACNILETEAWVSHPKSHQILPSNMHRRWVKLKEDVQLHQERLNPTPSTACAPSYPAWWLSWVITCVWIPSGKEGIWTIHVPRCHTTLPPPALIPTLCLSECHSPAYQADCMVLRPSPALISISRQLQALEIQGKDWMAKSTATAMCCCSIHWPVWI